MMKDKKKKKKKGDDITEAMRGSVSNQFGKYGSPGLYCNFSDCRADIDNDDQWYIQREKEIDVCFVTVDRVKLLHHEKG